MRNPAPVETVFATLQEEKHMQRVFLAALFASCCLPAASDALELKNIKVRYGPMGAIRETKTFLPGDLIFITYDIEDLTIDPKDQKSGKVSYVAVTELLDADKKVVYSNENPQTALPQLGGTRLPVFVDLQLGTKRPPGNYSLRVTVRDQFSKPVQAKAFQYSFELVPATFGMIHIAAPLLGFPGQFYHTDFTLTNLTLNAKQTPDTMVRITILDSSKKPVAPTVEYQFPRDLPPDLDLQKSNMVPIVYPVYLNRVGHFTMEIVATDKIGKKEAKLSYPLTVIDINTFK